MWLRYWSFFSLHRNIHISLFKSLFTPNLSHIFISFPISKENTQQRSPFLMAYIHAYRYIQLKNIYINSPQKDLSDNYNFNCNKQQQTFLNSMISVQTFFPILFFLQFSWLATILQKNTSKTVILTTISDNMHSRWQKMICKSHLKTQRGTVIGTVAMPESL